MEIYRHLPTTDQTCARPILKGIQAVVTKPKQAAAIQLSMRVDVLKLAICSFVDTIVHTGTAIAKCAVGVVQLPLYPVWDGVIPNVAFSEAGTHLALAVQSVLAIVLVPIPALVSPDFAITSYRWLSLGQESKDGLLAKTADRVSRVVKDFVKHQHSSKVLVALAAATAAAVGHRYYFQPDDSTSSYLFLVGVIPVVAAGIAGCVYRCHRKRIIKQDRAMTGDQSPVPTAPNRRSWTEPLIRHKSNTLTDLGRPRKLDFNQESPLTPIPATCFRRIRGYFSTFGGSWGVSPMSSN